MNAVIAFYYYARVIKTMWFDPAPETPEKDTSPISGSLQLAIGLAAVMTFVLGVLPGLADSLARAAQL